MNSCSIKAIWLTANRVDNYGDGYVNSTRIDSCQHRCFYIYNKLYYYTAGETRLFAVHSFKYQLTTFAISGHDNPSW